MNDSPALEIDWESGEGRVLPGERLSTAPARLRYDVLVDWKDQIDLLFIEAEASLYPGKRQERARYQLGENARRRMLCERLAGQTIAAAEPLVNGDILLHLSSGKSVAVYAFNEDIKLDVVADVTHARCHAARACTGDYYVREELPEERATAQPERVRG